MMGSLHTRTLVLILYMTLFGHLVSAASHCGCVMRGWFQIRSLTHSGTEPASSPGPTVLCKLTPPSLIVIILFFRLGNRGLECLPKTTQVNGRSGQVPEPPALSSFVGTLPGCAFPQGAGLPRRDGHKPAKSGFTTMKSAGGTKLAKDLKSEVAAGVSFAAHRLPGSTVLILSRCKSRSCCRLLSFIWGSELSI